MASKHPWLATAIMLAASMMLSAGCGGEPKAPPKEATIETAPATIEGIEGESTAPKEDKGAPTNSSSPEKDSPAGATGEK